ncbi:MAG TPA: HesA/MoeB/ThiF family protein [Ignavibacteria bacterium]|nr:HesA/MoeB/ThiF family protein [Ignavibacteria bacterium]
MNSSDIISRYYKQTILKEFGKEAQEKLLNAKVLVAGTGGLGCPALLYLAAAGAGNIGIVDFDVADISNLQRQTLYGVDDIGKSKAETAAKKLKSFNPEIEFRIYDLKLDNQNALKIISDYDLVIDCTDNYQTRYLINDACVLLDKPLVYGAVMRFEGQAGVFNYRDDETGIKTNYRDLFPDPPDAGSAVSCNEDGVLGVVPGIIGTMQAAEAIKIITGIGDVLCNSILSYNILTNTFYKFTISKSEKNESLSPKSESEFLNYNYDRFCGVSKTEYEISVEEFYDLKLKENVRIIDVREKDELPQINDFKSEKIPMSLFKKNTSLLKGSEIIVLICQTGNRSLKAVEILRKKDSLCRAYSLSGGIEKLLKHQKDIRT